MSGSSSTTRILNGVAEGRTSDRFRSSPDCGINEFPARITSLTNSSNVEVSPIDVGCISFHHARFMSERLPFPQSPGQLQPAMSNVPLLTTSHPCTPTGLRTKLRESQIVGQHLPSGPA